MTKIILRTLAVGIGVIILGHLLLGCDESEGSAIPGSGQAGDAGGVEAPVATGGKCQIPSPTGDAVSPYGVGRDTPNFLFASISSSAERSACESFKASTPSVRRSSDGVYVATAGIDCSDVANDFRGTTGIPWCVGLSASDGSSCDGTEGTPACTVARFFPMVSMTTKKGQVEVRSWAICSSTSDTFVGWGCTQS
jgi:hypothetical protein